MLGARHVDLAPAAVTRRGLFTAACGGLIAATPGLAPARTTAWVKPRPADLSPADALDLLYAGNKRFAAGKPEAPHRDLDRIKQVADVQTPFAAFLGCADSRVPVEIVFDQGFGDLFVTRVAGNVTTPECIASLEYGTLLLGAKVLFVLGHTHCGAVSAAVKGDPEPGQISALFQHLRPAVKAAKGDVAVAVRENVKTQAAILSEASPVIAKLIKDGKLKVAGGVYELTTGKVVPVEL
jgi:carbonic anhydrase